MCLEQGWTQLKFLTSMFYNVLITISLPGLCGIWTTSLVGIRRTFNISQQKWLTTGIRRYVFASFFEIMYLYTYTDFREFDERKLVKEGVELRA